MTDPVTDPDAAEPASYEETTAHSAAAADAADVEEARINEATEVGVLERGYDATRPGVLLEVDDSFIDTHSSGYSNDVLNTREQRFAADPALEPELARLREEERLERAGLVRGVDGIAR